MSFLKHFLCISLLPSFLLFSMDTAKFNLKIDALVDAITHLQEQQLLDGEILIAQGDRIILHSLSQDIAMLENPQFMIGSISKQFTAVALLKALYDSSLDLNEVKTKL